jgi:chromosome segregation ATPase
MNKEYKCLRCGYTKDKAGIDKHIARKTKCKPLLADVPVKCVEIPKNISTHVATSIEQSNEQNEEEHIEQINEKGDHQISATKEDTLTMDDINTYIAEPIAIKPSYESQIEEIKKEQERFREELRKTTEQTKDQINDQLNNLKTLIDNLDERIIKIESARESEKEVQKELEKESHKESHKEIVPKKTVRYVKVRSENGPLNKEEVESVLKLTGLDKKPYKYISQN